jgi:hypothetical protein
MRFYLLQIQGCLLLSTCSVTYVSVSGIRDPVPFFYSWIRDTGWVKNPGSYSESLEIIFWVKILKYFDADPGSGMEKIQIRDRHPGSATLATCEILKMIAI